MGNCFTYNRAGLSLWMSNGGTSVFLSVLLLAGSDLARSGWECEMMVWLADNDQAVFGAGTVGFDLDEIAWEPTQFATQKAFLLHVIDVALTRHRWNALDYDPPVVADNLKEFRVIVEAYSLDNTTGPGKSDWAHEPTSLGKCVRHEVFVHARGCLLCHDMSITL
ncbi:MAG: hypothetical protein ABJA67_16035 [Chthonomonadales bacterium]